MGTSAVVDSPAVSITPARLPSPLRSKLPTDPSELHLIAKQWLSSFLHFLSSGDDSGLPRIFLENSYWRDHLCLSWDLHTFHGPARVGSFLAAHPKGIRIKSVGIDESRSDSVVVAPVDFYGDVEGVQVTLTVSTDVGSGRGVAKLVQDETDGQWKAFTLYTVLESLTGHEEAVGSRRPHGVTHGTEKWRRNWKDRRDAEQECGVGEDPIVLIIGAGQSGLSCAARLKVLGVKALIIDKNERVGDNWRNRYHHLVIHDTVHYDHLPYLHFPPNWPEFTPKDKIADWLDTYAKAMELNVWMSSTVAETPIYSASEREWTVTISHSGVAKTLHPKHIVMATGQFGEPNIPVFPGVEDFKGERLCHSSQFSGAKVDSKGLKAVVVGGCNSAHDIAQDYYERGAEVTMVQRSSTYVMTSENGLDVLLKGLYKEGGLPVEDADLHFSAITYPVLKRLHQDARKEIGRRDHETLDSLTRAGFKLDEGPDGAGFFIKYLERGGGYYLDVGASNLVGSGELKVKQGQEIKRILPRGIEFADGEVLEADEIVLATGYGDMRSIARRILGDETAQGLKPVWGFDGEGETRSMWRRSGKDGIWFMGGNFALARYFSRILALQIKAIEEGLMSYNDL